MKPIYVKFHHISPCGVQRLMFIRFVFVTVMDSVVEIYSRLTWLKGLCKTEASVGICNVGV